MIKYIASIKTVYRLVAGCSALIMLGLATESYALKSDANQLVHITSDSVQYSNKTGIAKYVGHVHVKQGTTTIDADELQLFRNNAHDINKVIAKGRPARYSTQPDELNDRFHANAYTIEYYPLRKKIYLIKNGLAILGKDRFSGPKICYDINQQLIESEASPEAPTTIILQPRHRASATSKRHS